MPSSVLFSEHIVQPPFLARLEIWQHHGDAMHSATGANLVDIPDRILDFAMIEIDPMLKMGSIASFVLLLCTSAPI